MIFALFWIWIRGVREGLGDRVWRDWRDWLDLVGNKWKLDFRYGRFVWGLRILLDYWRLGELFCV